MPIFSPHDIYGELVILLLVAAVIGAMAVRLRQPLVIGFIVVGILAGPSGFNWIKSTNQIHLFAEMGLALLLFIVGLRLDLHIIRSMGMTAVTVGLAQVVLTTLAGFLLVWVLGVPPLAALYVALALTFSSTIIIVKLLSDKHETDSLHGRLTLGILIVQDLVVVLAMILLSATGGGGTHGPLWTTLLMLGKATAMLVGLWFATVVLLPRILPFLARSTELLVLFGIAWALIVAYLGDVLGFGKEVGAFLAGVALASTSYREILGAKLVSLRDFLLLFFFINLGSEVEVWDLGAQLWLSLILALFVLFLKPLLVMVVLALKGYRKRTSFLTGLNTAQISEFSLILVAMGAQAGHLDRGVVGMVTLVGLITIGFSSYLIQYAQGIYDRLAPHLAVFGRHIRHREDREIVLAPEERIDVILFGIGGYGTSIAEVLQARERTVLGVDFDPQAVRLWEERGWSAVFGDAEDPDFAASLPLAEARWVISAVRDPQINVALARAVRHAGYQGNIAFTARSRDEGQSLLQVSPGLLLVPAEDAAVQAVDLVFLTEAQIARETMDKIIAEMKDHYVVCGYGRMGQQIARDFRAQGVPFVIIEDNPEQLPRLRDAQTPHIVGKASQDETLEQAGIRRAKGLIAVASTDEENVFIVLTARGINPNLLIVARSLREENEDKLRRAGADRVMSPYILGGRRMAAAVTRPGVMDFLDLVMHSEHFDTEIGYLPVATGSAVVGKSIIEIGLWQNCGVTVLAVEHADKEIFANPCPDYRIEEGDQLIIMGSGQQIAAAKVYLSTANDGTTISSLLP